MPSQLLTTIFKNASTTYFTSTLFFPKPLREKIFTLYCFVRTVDDFIDSLPQNVDGFYAFRAEYYAALTNKTKLEACPNEIITGFIQLQRENCFRQSWINAFFKAMECDIYKSSYATLEELELYMYGSAEVIGLMIAACMGLKKESYPAARALGKSMQYANFLRDIAEDTSLGRQYIPDTVLQENGLKVLSEQATKDAPEQFKVFFMHERERYLVWQKQAANGYHHLPKHVRAPVLAASRMYSWTLETIANNPAEVFRKKIKPSKMRVVFSVFLEFCKLYSRK